MRSWLVALIVVVSGVSVAGCGSVVDVQPDASANKVANGDACGTGSECASANCIDGVCCDTSCDGICEACNVPGLKGTCSPVPANSDPATECKPLGTPDAGQPAGDGGMALSLPDGGIAVEGALCAGSCDGNRACQYPGTTKSCGDTYCSTGVEAEEAVCDGAGHCAITPFECNGYVCGGNACKTSCTTNADCDTDHYCNGGACVPKLGVATICQNGTQCATGYCDNGVCCSSDCSMIPGGGGNCAQNGSVGQCVCVVGGVTCSTGCQPYYPDADGDGYGDAHGTAVAGCGTTAPPPSGGITYVADNTDCYDALLSAHPRANQAHPGSTYYGTQDRGDGSYDYNCDGAETKFYVERPGAVCGNCAPPENLGKFHLCSAPDASYCANNTSSTVQLYQTCELGYVSSTNTYNCDDYSGFFFFCLPGQPCPTVTAGLTEVVACGGAGNFVQCGACSSGAASQTTTFATQSCN